MCGLHSMSMQTCIAVVALRVRCPRYMKHLATVMVVCSDFYITIILSFSIVIKSSHLSVITYPRKHSALYYRRLRSITCSDAHTPNGLMTHESSFHTIRKEQHTNFQIYLVKYAQAEGASKHFQGLIHWCQVVTHHTVKQDNIQFWYRWAIYMKT